MKWKLNVPDDNTVFLLRDINCHTRIKSILKSFEKFSSSKITFQNFRPYGLGQIKIELINKSYGYNFPLKYLESIL